MGLTNAHAVVIGVSQYWRVRPRSSVADAEGVADVLRDPGGYDPANVVLLQESDASREQSASRTRSALSYGSAAV